MDRKSTQFKQTIYELMNGTLRLEEYPVEESDVVANEFAEGKLCDALYQEVFLANMRLCARLGVDEDADAEIMITNLLEIAKQLSMKMYDYGVIFSQECEEEKQLA